VVASTRRRRSQGGSSRLVDAWAQENPRSQTLHKRAREALPGGLAHDVRHTDPFPLSVARAEGAHKWDVDGHELVCYVMGHGSLLFGHGHAPAVAAVRDQAGRSFHPGACHELEREWAEEVIRLIPSAERVRFTSSGTEATLLALQVARAVTGRPRIVKLVGHFHGWHDYASFGVDPPFERPATPGIPSGVAGTVTVIPAEVVALERTLAQGDVAAVVLEPSGAAWGAVPLPDGFLAVLRQRTQETGALLVFDEVVTGFRWAPGGVQELSGERPDLTALAKILAGGLPGGALAGRAELMEALAFRGEGASKVSHPGTHNAHPLSAAAGIATLRLAASGEPQADAARLAVRLRAGLNDVLAKHGARGCAYGQSSTFCLLLGIDGRPETLDTAVLKTGVAGPLSAALHCGMLLEGVHLFHGCGFMSTAHTADDVERTIAAFDATVPRLQAEGLLD
jgi:glutamate-1-semialdehyde 2,1-aminomutase